MPKAQIDLTVPFAKECVVSIPWSPGYLKTLHKQGSFLETFSITDMIYEDVIYTEKLVAIFESEVWQSCGADIQNMPPSSWARWTVRRGQGGCIGWRPVQCTPNDPRGHSVWASEKWWHTKFSATFVEPFSNNSSCGHSLRLSFVEQNWNICCAGPIVIPSVLRRSKS